MVRNTFIIQGKGSIGVRHAQNLKKLGYNVVFFRSNNNNFYNSINFQETYDFNKCLEYKPLGAIIATPSVMHPINAIDFLRNDIPVYIEKPLGVNIPNQLINVINSYSKKLTVHCGYYLRYSKEIDFFFEKVKKGNFNKITFNWNTNIKDWHPWEDYKKSYSANNHLGGGVAHTCSHEIDLAYKFYNDMKLINFEYRYNKKLDLITSIKSFFKSKKNEIYINLNFLSDKKSRFIIASNEIRKEKFDLNSKYQLHEKSYIESIKDFIKCINTKNIPVSNFKNSLKTYKICQRLNYL